MKKPKRLYILRYSAIFDERFYRLFTAWRDSEGVLRYWGSQMEISDQNVKTYTSSRSAGRALKRRSKSWWYKDKIKEADNAEPKDGRD